MEPLDYLKLLQRRWYIPVLTLLLGVAAAWVMTPAEQDSGLQARTYTATHTLYQSGGGSRDGNVQQPETIALLATTGGIPDRVAERMEDDDVPAILAAQMAITGDNKAGTITVSTTQGDEERAERLANIYAEELVAYFDEQEQANQREAFERAEAQMQTLEERIRDLDRQLASMPEEEGGEGDLLRAERTALVTQYSTTVGQVEAYGSEEQATAGLVTLQPAVAIPVLDEEGFQPPTGRGSRVGIAAVVGVILGLGLILLLDQLDTRVRTRRGAEHAFGLPVITEVTKLPRRQRRNPTIVTVREPGGYAAEAYRVLRLSLQLMPRWILPTPSLQADATGAEQKLAPRPTEGPATVVLVTSPGPAEGKTVTVVNLAACFAEVGKVVLIVDCDFRHPEQHLYFGVERGPGVSDYLAGGSSRPPLRDLARKTDVEGVWVVPGGTPADNPGRLVGPDQDLLAQAAELADVVVVDAGPILAVNDPAALMPRADAVVVVARSGHTTAEAAYRTSELLARLEAHVLGVALVGVPRASLARRYYTRPSGSGKAKEELGSDAGEPTDQVMSEHRETS